MSWVFLLNSKRECSKLRTTPVKSTPVPDRGLDSLALFACELGCCVGISRLIVLSLSEDCNLRTRAASIARKALLGFASAVNRAKYFSSEWSLSWLTRWTWIGRLIDNVARMMHVLLAARMMMMMMSRAAKYSNGGPITKVQTRTVTKKLELQRKLTALIVIKEESIPLQSHFFFFFFF